MFLSISCNHSEDEQRVEEKQEVIEQIKVEDIEDFRQLSIEEVQKLASEYVPINGFMQDCKALFGKDSVSKAFHDLSPNEASNLSSIFLLKTYNDHLVRAHQGYDLYGMREGNAGIIINAYLKSNDLPLKGEFMNSGIVYHLEKEKVKNDSVSISLLETIADQIEMLRPKRRL